ncbi:MAG TPA: lamin tail domain-containing protein [Anaerolineales bacterium]
MRQWKRLVYYLLINILVSACTVLAVLMIWDRTQTPATLLTPEPSIPVISALSTSAPTQEGTPPTQETPGPTSSPTSKPSPIGDVEEYQVGFGDTLGQISDRFDVPIEELMRVNQINDPNALSVGMVLYIPVTPQARPSDTPAPTSTSATLGTTLPTNPPQETRLIINAVISPGELTSEHVFITRTGDGPLSLAGWQLKDEDGNVFVFPQLDLYKDGAVNVWTTSGANTVVDLYWGLSAPIWKSGEKVTLLDANGKERATYTVP